MTTDQKVADVLAGRMGDLPPLNSQTVRIFTSSTFTDTVLERNMLMEQVYPKLREYCRRQHGLDFQVVDMRWGVRDEAADDHMTATLCLQEIRNCQKMSLGPNFVTFLGQRHGYRPFPATVDAKELEMLREALVRDRQDSNLLDEWFKKDTNCVPPVYVLQSISSKIPGFLSEDDHTRLLARARWTEVFTELQTQLRLASKVCCEEGRMTEDEKHKYFMSVTETEIYQGIFLSPGDPNIQCLCFVRIIDDMKEHLDHQLAWRFIDMVQSRIDEEAQGLLTKLRDEKVVQKLENFNVVRSQVQWSENGGINNQEHRDYLKSFSLQFFKSVKSLIEKGLKSHRSLSKNDLYIEVIQHLNMAEERCRLFCGREDLLKTIQGKVLQSSSMPVVVHGPSGCGKTSIMAKTISLVRQWIKNGDKAVVLTRFLGTSPASCDIRQVLQSLCCQISVNYGQDLQQVPQDVNDLVALFLSLLKLASQTKPIVLVLDSVDQLSSEYYAHRLAWLPRDLPDHVTCIVSTLPDEHEILNNLKLKLDEANFVEVPVLGNNLSMDILESWLKNNGRTLHVDQYSLVKNAFEKCSLPLYVKLVFEEVIHWRSYTKYDHTALAQTVKEVISNLFSRLEKKHGSILVTHSLAYVTASKNGLSESELEDILSLDDVVLTDVFQYHVPPVRRFPLILWLRIKSDISSYLVSREADNTSVVYWYHRQFIKAAHDRYLRGINFTKEIHKTLSEFFSGQWHAKQKPFTYTETQMRKLGLTSKEGNADRKVAAQPIVYLEDSKGFAQVYNKRKLNNLPYHLARSSKPAELKRTCLFNLEWITAKLEALSLQHILSDLDLKAEDPECKLLRSALNLARSTLRNSPTTLAQEILGRLMPHATEYNTNLRKLVDECFEEGPKVNAIVPRQQCFPAPGGSLKYTFEHSDIHVNQKMISLSPDSKHVLGVIQKNRMLSWDLRNGEIEQEVKLIQSDEQLDVAYCDSSGENLLAGCAFHKERNPVVIVNTTSGDIKHRILLDKLYPKIGFRDSYKLLIAKDKLIVHVHMRTVDCFQVPSGQFLHTICEQATHAHVLPNNEDILVHQKESSELLIFRIKDGQRIAALQASGTPSKSVTGRTIGNVHTTFTKSTKIDVITHYENSSYKISSSLDISQLGQNLVQDISLSADETLMLITTSNRFVVWTMFGNRLYRDLPIPPQVKPKHRVTSFFGCITSDMRSVVAVYNEHIIIWNILHGRIIRIIRACVSLEMNGLMVSADSSMAVTWADRNKTIKVWDLLNVEEEVHLPLALWSAVRYQTVGGSVQKPMLLMRTYNPKESRVLDVMSGKIVSSPSSDHDVMAPYITQDGKYAVLRGLELEEAINVWDSSSGELVSTIPVSSLYLRTYTTGSKSELVATHCESSLTEAVQVKLWNLKSGKLVSQLPITQGGFGYMFFLNQDRYLALLRQYPQVDQDQYQGLEDDYPEVEAGKKCTVIIFDVVKKSEALTLENVVKDSLYVLPDGIRFVFLEGDKSGDKLVCMDAIKRSVIYRRDKVPTARMNISKDGTRAVDVTLQVFDMESGDFLTKFELPKGTKPLIKQNFQTWPKISSDGKYVAWMLVREGLLNVGRVADGKTIGSCYVHSTPMSLQMCGPRVITCGCDDARIMLLHIIDAENTEEARSATESLKENAFKSYSLVDKTRADDDEFGRQQFSVQAKRVRKSALCYIL